MIIRQPEKNLSDTIAAIEDSTKLAFLIKPDEVCLPGKWVKINHLDMIGPWRWRAWYSKGNPAGTYNGPIWGCSIQIYPSRTFKNSLMAADYIIEEIAGGSCSMIREDKGEKETILTYHFDNEHQPPRQDSVLVIPHIVRLHVNNPKETTKYANRKTMQLDFGKLDPSLTDRIFFPPPPNRCWTDVGEAKKMVEVEVAAGRYKPYS